MTKLTCKEAKKLVRGHPSYSCNTEIGIQRFLVCFPALHYAVSQSQHLLRTYYGSGSTETTELYHLITTTTLN